MRGVVFLGDSQLEVRDFADPEPRQGEVVVAIKASGLCGSDLHFFRSPSGSRCIVGHEPAGIVHLVGPGVAPELAKVGDRVMPSHYIGCTKCSECRTGWPQMCRTKRSLSNDEHGGHAPYLKVPVAALVPLRDELSFEAGAAISCGTGTAWGGLKRLGDLGGSTLVVTGQGPVGLSATMLATAMGARVIAVDLSPERLAKAEHFGAVLTLNPGEVDVAAAIRAATGGVGAPLILETSGSTAAITSALESLALWGKICLIGLGGRLEFDIWSYFTRQITIMTSWTMSIVEQAKCADFIVEHQLPIDDLFTHRWTIDEAANAYDEFGKQTAGKAAFIF